MGRVSTVERAYQLAEESGSVEEVRRRLIREGYFYVGAHLDAPQLRRELKAKLRKA